MLVEINSKERDGGPSTLTAAELSAKFTAAATKVPEAPRPTISPEEFSAHAARGARNRAGSGVAPIDHESTEAIIDARAATLSYQTGAPRPVCYLIFSLMKR